MSFKLAKTFPRDAFPGEATLPCSSVKATVRATGNRLEAEAWRATLDTAAEVRRNSVTTGPARAALQIDAGYIRSIPRDDGTRWFAAVASKLVLRRTSSTPAHAYVTVGYDPTQGMRQQAFLRSIGIGVAVPLTILRDGGEDVECACRVPSGVEFTRPPASISAKLQWHAGELSRASRPGTSHLLRRGRVGDRLRDRTADEAQWAPALELPRCKRALAGSLRRAQRPGCGQLQALVSAGGASGDDRPGSIVPLVLATSHITY